MQAPLLEKLYIEGTTDAFSNPKLKDIPMQKPTGMERFEWPKEVAPKCWYRTIWNMIALYLALAFTPGIISSLFGFIPQDRPWRKLIFTMLHALRCGFNAPGILPFLTSILTVIGISRQKDGIQLPNQAIIFREISLTPKKNQSLWGYLSVLVYQTLPEPIYEKVFQKNYKTLLRDLNRRGFLSDQEKSELFDTDIQSHKEKVIKWIYILIGEDAPVKAAFIKFQNELDAFVSKFFAWDDVIEAVVIPLSKCCLTLSIICCFSDFTESGVTYDTIREFPILNTIGLFFSLTTHYCGLYLCDVLDMKTFFFNGIKKTRYNIKQHFENVETTIMENYC